VSFDDAWQKLSRRTFAERLAATVGGFVGWLTRSDRSKAFVADMQRSLPLLETVWLPTFRATMTAQTTARTATFDALVDAHSGQVVMADFVGAEWVEQPNEPCQLLAISAARALELARSAVTRAVISRPGWGRRFDVEYAGECELIGYPVWAYYFVSYRGMLDAKLLDAMTGAVGGARLKQALLATLAGRQRERNPED
jgi:hypothetical protein